MSELEKAVESKIVAYARARGWWCAKFTSPGLAGVPDRVFIRNGRVVFIEVKRAGERPRQQQVKRMQDMRDHGAEVHWTDSVEAVHDLLR